MEKIIKVKCTGAGRHINEINLGDLLGENVILYGAPIDTGRQIPERTVRKCEVCAEGKVVLTREKIEENL
jgi:kynurenine formamidase